MNTRHPIIEAYADYIPRVGETMTGQEIVNFTNGLRQALLLLHLPPEVKTDGHQEPCENG